MTDSALTRRPAPRLSNVSLILIAAASGAAVAVVFAMALQAAEPLLAGRLPAQRMKQLSAVWMSATLCVGATAALLSAMALHRRRRRFTEVAPNLAEYWRRF